MFMRCSSLQGEILVLDVTTISWPQIKRLTQVIGATVYHPFLKLPTQHGQVQTHILFLFSVNISLIYYPRFF